MTLMHRDGLRPEGRFTNVVCAAPSLAQVSAALAHVTCSTGGARPVSTQQRCRQSRHLGAQADAAVATTVAERPRRIGGPRRQHIAVGSKTDTELKWKLDSSHPPSAYSSPSCTAAAASTCSPQRKAFRLVALSSSTTTYPVLTRERADIELYRCAGAVWEASSVSARGLACWAWRKREWRESHSRRCAPIGLFHRPSSRPLALLPTRATGIGGSACHSPSRSRSAERRQRSESS